MKAWLKGGLIGIGIYLLLMIIFFLLPKGEFGNIGLLIIALITVPITILFHPSAACSFGGTCSGAIVIYIIYAIYFFLLGSLIGWLIQKLKKS